VLDHFRTQNGAAEIAAGARDVIGLRSISSAIGAAE
jgi:hypothetical protein